MIEKDFIELLNKANIPFTNFVATPLIGGANNCVYKLEINNNTKFVLKHYFSHPNDTRKRLQSEYYFLSYAKEKNIQNVPVPYSCIEEKNIALYSFIDGKNFNPEMLSEKNIQDAISFFKELNLNKIDGQKLPFASEACVTLNDYVVVLEKRLHAFKKLKDLNNLPSEAEDFIFSKLSPVLMKVKDNTIKYAKDTLNIPLSKEYQSITPSDFGFHNALLAPNQATYFIDFEYAGWDDPAKTVCDFFCQPKIPVPQKFFRMFIDSIKDFTDPYFEERIEIILPLCQLKWCFIIMNTFLKVGKNRRCFSKQNEDQYQQIEKAQKILKNIII